jgi:hypothetical protein
MEIIISESSIVESAVEMVNDLTAEVDRLNVENIKNSLLFERMKNHLSIFLCEMEERFNRTSAFESDEICQDYIKAATFMAENFGRTNNRVSDARHWYDHHSLNF